jgi:hypothetical protein
VSVRRNRGGRQFDPATTYTPSWNDSYITSIATADFDGDGAPDVAMADPGADRVSVMRNEGGGALGAPEDYALTGAGPREIAVADIDGDGANDLLTADATSASVSVLFNDGFGRFLAPIRFETPGSVTNEASFATGDFNGDGWVDVALANWQDAELHILLNQSDGTLAAVARHPTGGSYPSAVAAADLNQDGALDLAVSNLYGDNVAVFSNRGDGSFDSPTIYLLHLRQPWRMIATDMNSDGAADLVLANSFSNDLSILENQGGGLFGPIETYPAGIAPLTIAAADLDRNGRTDLALVDAGTAHRGDSTITVLSNHCETP